ncbi:MAG: leucine-rich repeat protein [Bacteroidales bacterium]|nr:leucine-rich repeat protein [Bacteroidales bacterium]
MKTIVKNILICLFLFFFASCVEDVLVEKNDMSVTIQARMETEGDTKTVLSELTGGKYYPLWSAGDEISVFADADKYPSRFTLVSGEGTTVSDFSGDRAGQEYTAIYPHGITEVRENAEISLMLPLTQEYEADSFGPGAFPMIATGTVSSGLKFMNLCAVMRISMTGTAAIKTITLTANADDTYLSGPATVNAAYGDEPQLVMSSGASSSVTLNVKGVELSEIFPSDFYIVIPAQTYKDGLTLTIDAYSEIITKNISTDLTFKRSEIRTVKDVNLDVEVPEIIVDAIPDNEIWYVTEGAAIMELSAGASIGTNLIFNQYVGEKGILRFDGDVTELGSMIFTENQEYLTELYLPGKITKIGDNVLADCFNLNAIYGKLATEDHKSLVLDGVLYAVAQHDMEEYVTPEGVTSLAGGVFLCNKKIKKVVLSEGVQYVDAWAFDRCESLEELYLPSTLRDVDGYAFARCQNVKRYYGDSPLITADHLGIAIDNYNNLGKRALVSYASGAENTSYTFPEDIELLENYCFYNALNLQSLTFTNKDLQLSSGSAFEGAYNIEFIYGDNVTEDNKSLVRDGELIYVAPKNLIDYTTPPGVTLLSYGVLADKPELVNVVMSDDVQAVGSAIACRPYEIPLGYILWDCPNLKTVTVSANMRIMGMDPFDGATAASIEKVYLRSPIPPVIGHNRPDMIPERYKGLTIYVPRTSLQAYKASPDWTPYSSFFEGYDYTDLPESDIYVSLDYSKDGEVVTLQKATRGNGIDIVLMGDAYSDRQITNGFYKQDMELLYNNLFAEEPYKSFKDCFNVYYINVISATEGYDYGNTALDTYFGQGTLVGGTDQAVFRYALEAITADRMDEAMIIVAMNSDNYAGTCYMYYSETFTDYASGVTVSYFPRGGNEEVFAQLLHHEANGHGFAKLADEYAYDYMGEVTSAEKTKTIDDQNYRGWFKNVDFTDDPTNVRWKHFLADSRYANEGLGVYEGGLTYWTGVWRPTENSIMRYNTGGFNAPSREAIYYRINKLAFGDSWEYDYEEFVEWDAANRSESVPAARRQRTNYVEKTFVPTATPVVINKSWKDAE